MLLLLQQGVLAYEIVRQRLAKIVAWISLHAAEQGVEQLWKRTRRDNSCLTGSGSSINNIRSGISLM